MRKLDSLSDTDRLKAIGQILSHAIAEISKAKNAAQIMDRYDETLTSILRCRILAVEQKPEVIQAHIGVIVTELEKSHKD